MQRPPFFTHGAALTTACPVNTHATHTDITHTQHTPYCVMLTPIVSGHTAHSQLCCCVQGVY